MARVFDRMMTLPVWAHGASVLASVGCFNWIKLRLDASYAASNHPVDYATGQTTFDGAKIKGFYAHMTEAGTLDIYARTQLIDFAFIAAILLVGVTLGTFVTRFAQKASWGRRAGLSVAMLATGGAACDAVENLISLVMLANPTGFPNWLAVPYSGFAVVKFALITAAMGALVVAIVLIVAGRISKSVRRA